MTDKNNAQAYVDSQRSLHLYSEARDAFVDVLSALPDLDFEKVTHNLILTVLHEGAIAQVMHFEPISERFRVLQLTIPHDASPEMLRWVIAHELGHVFQNRNWRDGDEETLEDDATAHAAKWGFDKTPAICEYLKQYRARFGTES